MIIGELFLDALVGFFNLSVKFAGMFSLFIPLYTSFSIRICIRMHPYLHLTKPAQHTAIV